MSNNIFLTPQRSDFKIVKRRSQIQPPQPQGRHKITNFAENMEVTSFSQRGTDFQPNITTKVTRVVLSDSMFSNNMFMTQQGIISSESELIDEFLAAICNYNAVEFEGLDQFA